MVRGQRTQTNQTPEFLTGRILTPHYPPSHLRQNLSTEVSQENSLPIVGHTPKDHNTDSTNSISCLCLAEAVARSASQQRPQAAIMLKSVSTNTLIFDGKTEKFELFADLFHTMLEIQPEMAEALKIINFHAHLQKEALQLFRNISAPNRKALENVQVVFTQKYVKQESQATATYKWHKLAFDPNTRSLSDFLKGLNECAKRQRPEYDKQPPLCKTTTSQ